MPRATNPIAPMSGSRCSTRSGQVLIGRRFRDDGPEIILPGLEWQMPQGGIDADENPRDAVMRELWEETGAVSADYLGETDWMTYEFPPYDGPPDASPGQIPRPAAEMVRAALHRPRRRDRPADAAQRPAGRIRFLALGAARPRRRSRRAVPARSVRRRRAAFRRVRSDGALLLPRPRLRAIRCRARKVTAGFACQATASPRQVRHTAPRREQSVVASGAAVGYRRERHRRTIRSSDRRESDERLDAG